MPRHPRKAVSRAEVAEVQGAQVDGRKGSATPKAEKVAKYLQLCDLLLRDGRSTQKQMQIVAGGFVYFTTFRRPLLGALNAVWRFIQSFVDGPRVQVIPGVVREELCRFCLSSLWPA